MYYSVRGKLIHSEMIDAHYLVVIECGGIGYGVKTTFTTMGSIDREKEVTLYTHLYVREDIMELFGFSDPSELAAFKLLLSVSGVGPKAALSILSVVDPNGFAFCIATGDNKKLAQAKGIGLKVSQRIVMELKDKISSDDIDDAGTEIISGVDAASGNNVAEAISALMVLGYSRPEATKAVSTASPDSSVEDMIKTALKKL